MRSTIERHHSYRSCPRCEEDVLPSQRFCRKCAFWLARPKQDEIRTIDAQPGSGKSWLYDTWLVLRSFQASLSMLVVGIVMGVGAMLLLVILIREVSPTWLPIGPMARQRACYANNRLIRDAIEVYCQENRFTRELASDPANVLWKAGYLHSPPQCPIRGNRYQYFFKATAGSGPYGLMCVGSDPHGLAD